MFLHKKPHPMSAKRLKTDVNLNFDASEQLSRSFNVQREQDRLVSRFDRAQLFVFSPAYHALITNDKTVCIVTEEGVHTLLGGAFDCVIEEVPVSPSACVFHGVTLVSGRNIGTYYIRDLDGIKVFDEGFSSMTVCADRVFGLYQKELCYTAAGQYDNWKDGEKFYLPAPCDAVVAVDGVVYVLGDSCYTLTPKADGIEFKFEPLAHNIGIVAPGSVVAYNGTAVFGSANGLFRISSGKITPIFTNLTETLDFKCCAATMFNGKYYLSCRNKTGSDVYNDVTLVLDLDEEKVVGLLHAGYNNLCATREKIYGVHNGKLFWHGEGTSQAAFFKGKIDFGCSDKKFLDALIIKTHRDLELTIRSECETRLYKVKGKKTAQKINLRGMGCEFSVEMTSNDGLDVESVELFAHVSKEV